VRWGTANTQPITRLCEDPDREQMKTITKSIHSPGPWKIAPVAPGLNLPVIIDAAELRVASIGFAGGLKSLRDNPAVERVKANARLIAAAPDMLDALLSAAAFIQDELAVRVGSFLPDPTAEESSLIAAAQAVFDTVMAAIDKAEGKADARRI
jgi:hypothetical protein